jgi:Uma2 family endonuclease
VVQAKPAPQDIAASPISAEQRLTLNNVSWETYEQILEALGEHRAAQITYSDGILEFMVPLEAHENPSDIIGAFIRTLVVESGANLKSMASTTLRRKSLQRGAEPDKCYYIQNEPLVQCH